MIGTARQERDRADPGVPCQESMSGVCPVDGPGTISPKTKNILQYSSTLPTVALRSPAFLASRFCKRPMYSRLQRTSISASKPSNHSLSTQHTGLSGRTYTIEHVLQEEVSPPRQVYRALADGHEFILKYIHPINFGDLREINNRLEGNAIHVLLAVDVIPDKSSTLPAPNFTAPNPPEDFDRMNMEVQMEAITEGKPSPWSSLTGSPLCPSKLPYTMVQNGFAEAVRDKTR